MIIKDIIDESFGDYKKPHMYIAMPKCSFKCCKDCNMPIKMCQNSQIAQQEDIEISAVEIIKRYVANPLTNAIVFGGLEPIDSFKEICEFLYYLRCIWYCKDDVVIYTGYNQDEVEWLIGELKEFGNIILKCGRYIPNKPKRFDEVLGVELISDNQYAIKL